MLQYADLEKKVEDVHSSYDRTGKELKVVEARLREVQPLIKNISNYQRLKPCLLYTSGRDSGGHSARPDTDAALTE